MYMIKPCVQGGKCAERGRHMAMNFGTLAMETGTGLSDLIPGRCNQALCGTNTWVRQTVERIENSATKVSWYIWTWHTCRHTTENGAVRHSERHGFKLEGSVCAELVQFPVTVLSLSHGFEVNHRWTGSQGTNINPGEGICHRVACTFDMADVGCVL